MVFVNMEKASGGGGLMAEEVVGRWQRMWWSDGRGCGGQMAEEVVG